MRPLLFLFTSGLLLSALQCLYLREFFAVFHGNELVLGAILAVWLGAVGLGSLIGRRVARLPAWAGLAGLMAFGTLGLMTIRASRLLVDPGESIPPLEVMLIILAAEFPPALCGGAVFGAAARPGLKAGRLYGLENGGGVLGCLIVYACVLLALPNAESWAAALAAAVTALIISVSVDGSGHRRGNLLPAGLACALAAGTLLADPASLAWKYPSGVSSVVYGRDGEIATRIEGRDTTLFLNGSMYSSTLDKPTVEQAVHLPMAQIPLSRRVLVLFDRGQAAELKRYHDLTVDRVETEPALVRGNARLISPEQLRPAVRYDAVFLGAGAPSTASANRFYTTAFFDFVKKHLLADSGIFTFTLPFSENYLSPAERRMLATVRSTLRASFARVWIVPGNGYTFMASSAPIAGTLAARVPTEYLASRIIPGIDQDRLERANAGSRASVNTAERPLTLFLALRRWMELYGLSMWILGGLLFVAALLAMALLPKSAAVLSIGTSGLVVGVASVTYLLLYQASYGALYSQIAAFMVVLSLGFSLGVLVPRGGHADLVIGLYVAATIIGLALVPFAPPALYFLVNFGLGLLAGAQFKGQERIDPAVLYAADMAGGVFGMALSTTVLLPLAGAVAVAIGLAVLKVVAWIVAVVSGRSAS